MTNNLSTDEMAAKAAHYCVAYFKANDKRPTKPMVEAYIAGMMSTLKCSSDWRPIKDRVVARYDKWLATAKKKKSNPKPCTAHCDAEFIASVAEQARIWNSKEGDVTAEDVRLIVEGLIYDHLRQVAPNLPYEHRAKEIDRAVAATRKAYKQL